ncbi:hypothetical protein [Novispirillum itersonii]|uniref:hypothetical protein n=1 Tax=Novispirillum itersonii TaxID=189 RepID=UPI00037D922F|nr:hypothetical protein [Novispirillum itersonii]
MSTYVFRKIASDTDRPWAVYKIDPTGESTLVERFESAPEAKRWIDVLRFDQEEAVERDALPS